MSEQHSALGYSAVSTFENCPYQYKLRYIDDVEMLDEYDAADPLKIGTALHRGIETDVQTAIKEYYMSYPVITDTHITEAIKLETLIPKVKAVIPDGQHEVFFEYGVFKGTNDLLSGNDDGTYSIEEAALFEIYNKNLRSTKGI